MDTSPHQTDWLMSAKWGVFYHFLAPNTLNSLSLEESVVTWNEMVDAFDVEALAKELNELGARYCMFTIGQNTGHYCSPNSAYDTVVKRPFSKCSHRDLILELADALAVYDIRLVAYFTNNAPVQDPEAVAMFEDALGERRVGFQNRWQDVIREWSLRWGEKVSGWWIDGSYFNDIMYEQEEAPNWQTFAAALRAGNNQSLLAFNPGVSYPPYTVTEVEDYTPGEVNEPQEVDGPGRWDKQAQFHYLSYLGQNWGTGPVRFTATEVIEYTRSITDFGGAVTWDVPHDQKGHMDPTAFSVLKALGQEIDPTRDQSVRDPLSRVKASVCFTTVPVMGDGGKGEGVFELTVKNPWDREVTDTLSFSVWPEGFGRVDGKDKYSFQLQAQQQKTIKIAVIQEKMMEEGVKPVVCLQREGDERILRYPFPVRHQIGIPRLADNVTLESLPSVMENIAFSPITTRGRCLGTIKLAVTGNNLAIVGEILDAQKVCTEMVWDGSCIELFGVAAQTDKINQLFLQPAVQGEEAKVLITPRGEKIMKGEFRYVPFAPGQYQTEDTVTGYKATALISIPEWLQVNDVPQELYIDISLTVGEKSDSFMRATLFGSEKPANVTDGYARVQVE